MISPANTPDLDQAAVEQMLADAQRGEEFAAVPTEGGTVQLPSTGKNLTVRLRSTTDLDAVTLLLPPEPASTTGQRVFIRTDSAIGALTVEGGTGVTVDDWTVNMQPSSNVIFYKFDDNIWSRL